MDGMWQQYCGGPKTPSVDAYILDLGVLVPCPPLRRRVALVPAMRMAAFELDGAIYACGGVTGPAYYTATVPYVLSLDPRTPGWQSWDDMPTPVSNAGVAVVGSRIYVVGGEARGARPMDEFAQLAAVQCYDAQAGRWDTVTRFAPMRVARSAHVVAALCGWVVVMGGRGDEPMYWPPTNTWEWCTPLPSTHSFARACVVHV